MSATPETPPDEAAPAPDAVLNDAPADADVAVDDGDTPEDDNADLYSEGDVSSKAKSAIVMSKEDTSNEVNDATDEADADGVDESDGSPASSAHDAGSDGNADDVGSVNSVDEGKAEVNEGLLALPPASVDEAAPDAESAEPTIQAVTDEPQPDADGESAVAAADGLPASDVSADAASPFASAPAGSDFVPALPSTDAIDTEDADDAPDAAFATADVDADAEDSPAAAQAAASAPSPLPYIDDIAMLDTGEASDIQPSAPTESSFTSSIQAQATSATSVDAAEKARSAPNDNGLGIDFDKMIDAISADAAKPPVTASQAPIGAPKGPSNPFPRPPTGPARMNGRYANNSILPNAPTTGTSGTMGGAVPLGSPPHFPTAAGGRRGQATRAAQGQPPTAPRQANNTREKAAVDRAYQAFLNEEKIHVAEGKWEAFPEGSRMFVGNLSQERVSKRDVFEHFHRYGRLAQIAIKSAYGFVQYHSVAEASAAMRELEGTEIRGRKIHLEISKLQKKEKGRERDSEQGGRERDRARGGKDRSPERTRTRGGRDREGDRYDGRGQGNGRRSRDDHYAGSHDGHGMSPREDRGRDDSYGRDRSGHDDYSRRSRDRSRSPNRHGSHSHGDGSRGYRSRRSPSPYGRNRNDGGRGSLGALKTRYGGDVPDVQFLVAQGLDREFIKWAQTPFIERGLRTDVIFLTPHTPPRDSIIQVHVLEGVTAVVDLDGRAQANGKIPVQVFNRSAGVSNVQFDGYQDLAPSVAADVVLRAKSAAAVQQHPQHPPHQAPYSQGYQGAPSYGHPYAPPQAAGYPSAPPATTAAPSNGIDLASLVGQLDNATLAQLLGAMQVPQAAPPPSVSYGQPPPAAQYAAPTNAAQQAQLAALLSTLGAAAAPASSAPPAYRPTPAPYAAGVPAVHPAAAAYQSAAPQGADEQSIQAIMAHFAKSRQ